jgi:hypothetical protein
MRPGRVAALDTCRITGVENPMELRFMIKTQRPAKGAAGDPRVDAALAHQAMYLRRRGRREVTAALTGPTTSGTRSSTTPPWRTEPHRESTHTPEAFYNESPRGKIMSYRSLAAFPGQNAALSISSLSTS